MRTVVMSLVMVVAFAASSMAATIWVSPSYQMVGPNTLVTVDIMASVAGTPDDRDILIWGLDVTWDSSVLQLNDVTEGDFLPGNPQVYNTFFQFGTIVPGMIDNLTGGRLNTTVGAVGTGVLATLEFLTVGGFGSYSDIELAAADGRIAAKDGLDQDLIVDLLPGRVAIPEPTTLALVGAGSALALLRRRKRA